MGFLNWKTADTEEPIVEEYVGQPKPIYLLQPNGKPPIREDDYSGYGLIGGVSVYKWLVETNFYLLSKDKLTDDQMIKLGIGLEVGSVYEDAKGGIHHVFEDYRMLVPGTFHDVTYDTCLGDWGKTPNELISEGVWKRVSLKDKLPTTYQYPLKFSFNPNAKYEDLPESQRCN